MKKLSVLAALAFVLAGSTIYARACDMGAITAYVTGTVVADCGGSACATDERVTTTSQPLPAAPKVTDGCNGNGCATDDPTLQRPVTIADCRSGSC